MSGRRNPSENYICQLPDELLLDICNRLPAKDVGKCRCIGKRWEHLLTSSAFIQTHTHTSRNSNPRVIATDCKSIYVVDGNAATKLSVYVTNENGVTNLKPMEDDDFSLVGSCDGLIMILTKDHVRYLVNPTTLQLFEVSKSPHHKYQSISGFGYDEKKDDYKIVIVSDQNLVNLVEVYSVGMKVWNRARNLDYNYKLDNTNSAVFVGGTLHWLALKKNECGLPLIGSECKVILAFHFESETFTEIACPNDLDLGDFRLDQLLVLQERLCLAYDGEDVMELRIMDEYLNQNSWMGITIRKDESDLLDYISRVAYGVGNDEIVLVTDENLVVYNIETAEFSEMNVDGVPEELMIEDGCTFVETLIKI